MVSSYENDDLEKYNTYVLYDETYLGPGYFIISELNREIVKYAKFYTSNNQGFAHYNVRAYAKGAVDIDAEDFREIKISVDKSNHLFAIFSKFTQELDGAGIVSMNHLEQGQNQLKAAYSDEYATLIFVKDVLGVRLATDAIDINFGDNFSCSQWAALNDLFQSLSKTKDCQTEMENLQQVL